MKLITKAIMEKLKANNVLSQKPSGEVDGSSIKPPLKLFGGSACTWLISEIEPDGDTMFGLCDLGMGFPEMGYVSLGELEAIKFPPFGLPVERDKSFKPNKSLSEYAAEASQQGYIKA